MTPKISIYSSAHNLTKNGFKIVDHFNNFARFGDELVIAVNESQDNTWQLLSDLKNLSPYGDKVFLVEANFSYSDPQFDGKLKNHALQHTAYPFKMGLDLDELVNLDQRPLWNNLCEQLEANPQLDALLIPSVNLWGNRERVRWDGEKNRAYKWYLHKAGLTRGPIREAVNGDGTINIAISDGCEILNEQKGLATCARIDGHLDFCTNFEDYFAGIYQLGIWVWHVGALDFDERVKRNREFWAGHWETTSGTKVETVVDKKQLECYNTFEHGLPFKV